MNRSASTGLDALRREHQQLCEAVTSRATIDQVKGMIMAELNWARTKRSACSATSPPTVQPEHETRS